MHSGYEIVRQELGRGANIHESNSRVDLRNDLLVARPSRNPSDEEGEHNEQRQLHPKLDIDVCVRLISVACRFVICRIDQRDNEYQYPLVQDLHV